MQRLGVLVQTLTNTHKHTNAHKRTHTHKFSPRSALAASGALSRAAAATAARCSACSESALVSFKPRALSNLKRWSRKQRFRPKERGRTKVCEVSCIAPYTPPLWPMARVSAHPESHMQNHTCRIAHATIEEQERVREFARESVRVCTLCFVQGIKCTWMCEGAKHARTRRVWTRSRWGEWGREEKDMWSINSWWGYPLNKHTLSLLNRASSKATWLFLVE